MDRFWLGREVAECMALNFSADRCMESLEEYCCGNVKPSEYEEAAWTCGFFCHYSSLT